MTKESEKGGYTSPDGSPTWEYIATMSCSLTIFCVGCIAGWNSPSLGILMGPESPIPLTSSDASTLSAMVSLGHMLSPMFTMVMADKLGRKNSILVSGIPTMISWGLIAVASHIMVLFVARFFGGLALGLTFCLPQMYLGEIASAKLRGAISMVCGIMLNAGVLFMFVIVPYLSLETTASICLTIVTIAVISVWFIPESPYFLAMAGKVDEAEGALEKLRGKTDVSEELELIKMTINQRGRGTNDFEEGIDQEVPEKFNVYKQLFTVAGNRKALFINFLFMAVLQFGGGISIMLFAQIIFERMKTGVETHLCTILIATFQTICTILTVFVIDRLGRRPLICISGVVSGACALVVAVYFYLMEHTDIDVTPYAMLALCAVFVDMVAINIGLMPLQHVIQSEILATEVKGLATVIIGVGGGMIAIVGVKAYLMLAETWNFGHSVPFFGFAANTWIITGLILKLLPETKGKTLFEIQRNLNA